jgi:CheY-like chemotaxis protein
VAVTASSFPARGGTALLYCIPPVMTNPHPIILAVDDDQNDLLFLKAAFKFIGAPEGLHTVSGGQEAVAYVNGDGIFADRERHPYPDFILTDLKMPGFDGFNVLEFLRKKPESAVIRAVVLSGSQDSDDIKKAYWLGASGYLVKPSSPIDLRKIVKTLHDFWLLCECPDREPAGVPSPAAACKKLGDRATAGFFDSRLGDGH